jgi:DNA-binding winged helix-turn-helix (wHTH) protein
LKDFIFSRIFLENMLSSMSDQEKTLYQFGPFLLDTAKQCLQNASGDEVSLRPQVIKVLSVLVQNHGHTVTKERMLEEVYGSKEHAEEGAISQCITALRKILGDDAKDPKIIETRRKVGYRFIAAVTEIRCQEIEPQQQSTKADRIEEPPNNSGEDTNSTEPDGSRNVIPSQPLPGDNISIAHLPTTGPDLFGRETELKLLYDAWESPKTTIITFVAWGGVGKTAMVNHWLKRHLAPEGFRGAEYVYGWSFYSQGTSERAASADLFIDQALRFFGGDELADTLATVSP